MAEYSDSELSADEIQQIAELLCETWPDHDSGVEDRVRFIERLAEEDRKRDRMMPSPRRYVLWEDNRAEVHAYTFERTVETSAGPLSVMALAGVAVAKGRRGQGLGRAVVRQAFSRVDSGEFVVSLFQTGVPDFYRKLDSRVIENRFVNSLSRADPDGNPWADEYVMIYPSRFAWPEGVIDLKGRGY
jgi:predicted N-acetyltransferase YhbS